MHGLTCKGQSPCCPEALGTCCPEALGTCCPEALGACRCPEALGACRCPEVLILKLATKLIGHDEIDRESPSQNVPENKINYQSAINNLRLHNLIEVLNNLIKLSSKFLDITFNFL